MATAAATIAEENLAAGGAFNASSAFKVTAAAKVLPRPSFALPWALGMIVVGLVTLAACVLVPMREENRQLAHELANVEAEAKFVEAQAAANAEFVERVHTDPALAERLVMRATRRPATGKQFLDFEQAGSFSSSPYALTKLDPPPAQPEYKSDLPVAVVGLFGEAHSRVIMIGAALFLVAAAVVLGGRSTSMQKA